MAKTKQPDPNDPAEIVRQLNTFIGDLTDMIRPALKTFAELQERRASWMRERLEKIEGSVGKEHTDYAAVRNALDQSVLLSSHFKTQARRIKKLPQPGAEEWLVYGQVLDAKSEPVEGLHVRLVNWDLKNEALPGGTETDRNGDFALHYHESDFNEMSEHLPELCVMVSDQNGEILYSSRDQIRFESGRSEYFLIQLREQAKEKTKRTKPTSNQRKRKS
jgi:hypothetical protein